MRDEEIDARVKSAVHSASDLLLSAVNMAIPNGSTSEKSQAICALAEIATARAIALVAREDPRIWDKENQRLAR